MDQTEHWGLEQSGLGNPLILLWALLWAGQAGTLQWATAPVFLDC